MSEAIEIAMDDPRLPTKQELGRAMVKLLREDAYMGTLSSRLPAYYGTPRELLLPVIDWLESLVVGPDFTEIAERVKRIEQSVEKWSNK